MTGVPVRWSADQTLTKEVEAQFDSALAAYAAKPTLISEHANHEESIRTGGYAGRTLLELVQNAADAMVGADSDVGAGRVEIILDPSSKTLYCANSGRPFSKSGLTAITHAHLSGKRGDEIGRFGLGFKSVLAVSDSPQVLSRSVSFEFNSPKAQNAIRAVEPVKRLPVLRTATLLDARELIATDSVLAELSQWATTIVRLPGVQSLEKIRSEMESFSSEFMLFVSAVREIRLVVTGDDGFATIHTSRELGNCRYKIERPDGSGDEWLVGERMHAPSVAARREVGEAVSRDEIKVSVALPLRARRANTGSGDEGTQVGQFWSYFPLRDRTSATGFFNAPWSVNDDRTTLLRNTYNREILHTLAELFVELLPRLSTPDDVALQLDYLPARGREATYYGDQILCAHVPVLAVAAPIIPDGEGRLSTPETLRPLDFLCDWKIPEVSHKAWSDSPNTGSDVPHWRCYNSPRRITRLRELFEVSVDPARFSPTDRDMKAALSAIPKRGIRSWLREWAEGDDAGSAADALDVVVSNRGKDGSTVAPVIPTSEGMRSLGDSSQVFLAEALDLEIEDAAYVKPEFLAFGDVERTLRAAGFRELDPTAVFTARLNRLRSSPSPDLYEKFWDAAIGVTVKSARETIKANKDVQVCVPTRDGGWRWPQQVLDLDVDVAGAERFLPHLLDRSGCLPELARELGVSWTPRKSYELEDEIYAAEYEKWALGEVNSQLGRGERPVERVALYYRSGMATPGPFSALFVLRDTDAPDQIRELWTRGLLEFGDEPWDCEDVATNASYPIASPVKWAVGNAGILKSSLGYRMPSDIVDPSLVQYKALLPLFEGPRAVAEALDLPDELRLVSTDVLRQALDTDLLPPSFSDDVLVTFILEAGSLAYGDALPPRIPARVGRTFESCPARGVFVAVDEEQRNYLAQHHRPYLSVSQESDAKRLVDEVGCLRFEDTFAFSINVEGRQDAERLLDVFTGLRDSPIGLEVTNASIARAESVEKWVTTADGVEAQSLDWHRDGVELVVRSVLDERSTLRIVSEAFDLGFNNSDIDRVLRSGIEQHLELLRLQALSASDDVAKLEIYIGDDDLRDKLPSGLWSGLEAQGLVSARTSVAELVLSVYGKDTVKELVDVFRREGFTDVPTQWAGGGATVTWLRKMGFGPEFAGRRAQQQDAEFVVPGSTVLPELHDYQSQISEALREQLLTVDDGGRRAKAMVELPTGAGKTRVATQTILQLFIDGQLGGPVLWIAQSGELCEQAVQTFSEVWRSLCADQRVDMPLTIGRLWHTNQVHEPDTLLSVIIATDAKLEAVNGLSEYDWLSRPSAVFVDEGHVAGNSTRYTKILSWLGVDGRNWSRPLIGLSATPFKGTSVKATDQLAARFGRNKLEAFKENPYQQLVSRGVLARVRHEILEGAHIDMSVDEQNEARQLKQLSRPVLDRVAADHARMSILVDKIMGLPAEWAKSVLVFTPNVLSAQILAAILRFRGVEAASVSGKTGRQERRDVIDRFKKEQIQVLTNCDLLTQGFDAPGVTALFIAKPTFSPNAYIQMAGRGLRGPRNGGKDECLIVDMADNFGTSDINNLLGFREYETLWQEQQT